MVYNRQISSTSTGFNLAPSSCGLIFHHAANENEYESRTNLRFAKTLSVFGSAPRFSRFDLSIVRESNPSAWNSGTLWHIGVGLTCFRLFGFQNLLDLSFCFLVHPRLGNDTIHHDFKVCSWRHSFAAEQKKDQLLRSVWLWQYIQHSMRVCTCIWSMASS